MPIALISALFFTVTLLVVTAYFLMGSLPLLVLKHDTPLDARFIRGFFNTYCVAAMFSAGATALSYAWAGMPFFSISAAIFALVAGLLRRLLIPKMDLLRAEMQVNEGAAVTGFRRLHIIAIAVNVTQLVLMVWSLVLLSLQLR